MRLYAGPSSQFIELTTQNIIADKLKDTFFDHFRYYPSPTEVQSWRNSLRAVSLLFLKANLNDHGVILEYQLPLTSLRLDCMITGRNRSRRDNAVIVELKQWEKCMPADGEKVVSWVGRADRELLHPSVQVGQYKMYLEDTSEAFHEARPISLHACSYLHNYTAARHDVLFSDKFEPVLANYPVFTADGVNALTRYLRERLGHGAGMDVLNRVEQSRYRPSKQLMRHVSNMIKGKPEYILLDEQLVVYDKVFACARKGFHDRQKTVLIVRGGPGTGKSVIAINLMADLLRQGYNAHYATGSRAFTGTLRRIIGQRGSVQFKFFNSYVDAEPNEVDVLIADEAHRVRLTSNSRWMRKSTRSARPQIDELINVAKVAVFLLDDDQVVRPDEIGSADYIRDYAHSLGCRIFEYELEAQFRCAGSDAFVNWVNNTLNIKRTANVIWEGDERFDFQIVDSPHELERKIREKAGEGYTARVTAGFCWPWSDPNRDGTLPEDVVIGDYRRPWDARPEARRLAPGIPPAHLWAYEPGGIDQVGCVYTAQGFEFDYIGVIFGLDLRFNFDSGQWEGHPEKSADSVVKRSKDRFIDLVKNTYRVLLTRGLQGCYVHFMDKETEKFIRTRMAVGEKPPVPSS